MTPPPECEPRALDLVNEFRELGDEERAEQLLNAIETLGLPDDAPLADVASRFRTPAYKYMSHDVGFIDQSDINTERKIVYPGAAMTTADPDKPLKIMLNRLRTYDYPGSGSGKIFVNINATHIDGEKSLPVSWNLLVPSYESTEAPLLSFPIFIGLNPGKLGLQMGYEITLAQDDSDEAVLEVLDSDAFKSGLKIVTTWQPVIAPFCELATGIAKMIFARNRKRRADLCTFGLWFSPTSMGFKLAKGDYIFAQVPHIGTISWSDYIFDSTTGIIRMKNPSNDGDNFPYNYVVIGINDV
jgi:hypothetical protein